MFKFILVFGLITLVFVGCTVLKGVVDEYSSCQDDPYCVARVKAVSEIVTATNDKVFNFPQPIIFIASNLLSLLSGVIYMKRKQKKVV